ncbi:trichohyalin-like isoform X2 [Polypterus senegalus]|uniref:trichohyalin-like isoform X2 n=1 Tax=Polypterus senegalus TaxID=55291 RepID=UPI001966BAC0|nr:trichohyalin-like isoform X2 [Polypterus senegalus]
MSALQETEHLPDQPMRTAEQIQSIISKNNILILQMKLHNNMLKKKLETKLEAAVQKLEEQVNKKIEQMSVQSHYREALKCRLEEMKQHHSNHVHMGQTEQETCQQKEQKPLELQSSLEKAHMKYEEAQQLTLIYLDIKKDLQAALQTQKDLTNTTHHLRELHRDNYDMEEEEEREKDRERLESPMLLTQHDPEVLEGETLCEAPAETAIETTATDCNEIFQKFEDPSLDPEPENVVQLFISQSDTLQQLEHLASKNNTFLECLKEEQRRIKEELNLIRYTENSRLTREHQDLEELIVQLRAIEKRRDDAGKRANELSSIHDKVRTVLENLDSKLQVISTKVKRVKKMTKMPPLQADEAKTVEGKGLNKAKVQAPNVPRPLKKKKKKRLKTELHQRM